MGGYFRNTHMTEDLQMKKIWIGLIFVGLLAGCAGIGLSPAKADFEKAMGFFNHGEYEKAATYFAKAIEADPKHGQAHLYLGRSYVNLRQWQKALPPLRTAYRIAPKDTRRETLNVLMDALLGSAGALFEKGQFKDGLSYLKEGLNLSGENALFFKKALDQILGFGTEMLEKGNAKAAVEAFSETIKMAPDKIEGYIGLAKAFLAKGNLLKALETAKKALSLNPSAQDAKELFNQLAK